MPYLPRVFRGGRTSRASIPDEVDVLLINPPWDSRYVGLPSGTAGLMPPVGLLSVAAYAEHQGLRVRVFDMNVERWGAKELRAALRTVRPSHVGISLALDTAVAGHRVARIVKEVHPGATVVVGGVHATERPTECLKNGAIDVVVRGEGEKTFARILAGRLWEQIPGISYRRGSKAIHNPPAESILDLDSLPMPAYHLVPTRKYRSPIGPFGRMPAIPILATRGSAGDSTMARAARTPIRVRSGRALVEEIADLRSAYGVSEVVLLDDTFALLRKKMLQFCALMRQRSLDVVWAASVRPDRFDESMATAMKEAGCYRIMLNVESPNPIRRTIQIARAAGLEVLATFTFSQRGETGATVKRAVDEAVALDPDAAEFYESISSEAAHSKALSAACRRAHRAFYSRPAFLWRHVKRIRDAGRRKGAACALCGLLLRRLAGMHRTARREWFKGSVEDFWTLPDLRERAPGCSQMPAAFAAS